MSLTTEDLFTACKNGDCRMILICIKQGISVNSIDTDDENKTPLLLALESNHEDAASLLLDSNATTDLVDSNGLMAIHYAIQYCSVNMMIYILDKSHDYIINAKDFVGWTPLHHAVKFGDYNHIETLLKRGANHQLKTNDGMKPMNLALATSTLQVSELLRQWDKFLIFNHIKFIHALDPERQDMFVPLSRSARPNYDNENHHIREYFESARRGDLGKLQHLFESYSHFTADDKDRKYYLSTTLMYAAGNGHLDIIKYLIEEKEALSGQHDQFGNLALHYASYYGHVSVVDYLLKHNISHRNWDNRIRFSPLHCACFNENPNVVRVLLKYHASIDNKNCDGKTPYAIAIERELDVHAHLLKYPSIVGFMERHKLNEDVSLAFPVHAGILGGNWITVIRVLQNQPTLLNQLDTMGRTPTDLAAIMGQMDVVKHLKARGGNFNLHDEDIMMDICKEKEPYRLLLLEYLHYDEILSTHIDDPIFVGSNQVDS